MLPRKIFRKHAREPSITPHFLRICALFQPLRVTPSYLFSLFHSVSFSASLFSILFFFSLSPSTSLFLFPFLSTSRSLSPSFFSVRRESIVLTYRSHPGKKAHATFSEPRAGPGRGLSVLRRRDDLGKHFIAFDTMVKNAQGSDSKKCNW